MGRTVVTSLPGFHGRLTFVFKPVFVSFSPVPTRATLSTSLIQELTLSEVKQLENCSTKPIRSNESDFAYEFDKETC